MIDRKRAVNPICAALTFLLLTALGCERKPENLTSPSTSISASSRRALRADLAALDAIIAEPGLPEEDMKQAYFRVFGKLIARLTTNQPEREAAMKYVRVTPHDSRDRLTQDLPIALFRSLLDLDDKEGLRTLLAATPIVTDSPDGYYIEFALVNPYQGRQPSDIFILFDAYERATAAHVKENLMAAIRRAFADRIRPGETDSEIVGRREAIMGPPHLLKANKEWSGAYSSAFFEVTNFVPPPLFIPKNGPDSVEGTILR
jgi:hypothetical protein